MITPNARARKTLHNLNHDVKTGVELGQTFRMMDRPMTWDEFVKKVQSGELVVTTESESPEIKDYAEGEPIVIDEDPHPDEDHV